MANSNNPSDDRFVDERVRTLDAQEAVRVDTGRARARLQARMAAPPPWKRRLWFGAAVVAAVLVLLALPWPRAAAQRLWDRLSLSRVEVVQDTRNDSPDATSPFGMKEEGDQPIAVRDAAEAERVAGFHPLFPRAGILPGTPKLTVVKRSVMSSTVKVV